MRPAPQRYIWGIPYFTDWISTFWVTESNPFLVGLGMGELLLLKVIFVVPIYGLVAVTERINYRYARILGYALYAWFAGLTAWNVYLMEKIV